MPHANSIDRNEAIAYHVYNRGDSGRDVFIDDDDRDWFFWLIKRHLTKAPMRDARGREFASVGDRVTLLAANLMTTHFHLVIWQRDRDGISRLMNLALSAYARHFDRKHGLQRPLFDGRFRAKPVRDEKQFRWLIGYVHDNHPTGLDYRYSTHRCYVDPDDCPSWIDADVALRQFGGVDGYRRYLQKRDARNHLTAELF